MQQSRIAIEIAQRTHPVRTNVSQRGVSALLVLIGKLLDAFAKRHGWVMSQRAVAYVTVRHV